jgi:hypothetical protein
MFLGRWSITYGSPIFTVSHFIIEAATAQIITGLVGVVLARIYREQSDVLANAQRNLVLVLLLGAINGLTWILSIEVISSLPVSAHLAVVRVFMTTIITLVLFFGYSRYRDLRNRYLLVRAEVVQVQDHLDYLAGHAQELVHAQTQSIQEITRGELIPRITEIQTALRARNSPETTVALAEQIQQVINAGVRPISHQLAAVKPQVELPKSVRKIPNFFRINPRINVARAIDPKFWVIYPFPLLLGSQLQLNGLRGILPMVFYVATGVLLAKVAALLLPKRDFRLATVASLLLALSVGIPILASRATVRVFATAPSTWGLIPERVESEYIGAGPLFFVFAVYANLLTNNYRDLTVQLAALRATEDRELAGLRQQLWATNRNWAYLLHGKVQASLVAAVTRLKLGMTAASDLELINLDLQRALTAISSAPEIDVDFFEQVAQLEQAWQGICQISVLTPSSVNAVIRNNPTLSFALNEVVREAVSNAIRHGGAKNVDIAIDASGSNLLLQIENDGELPTQLQGNLGMSLLDELTIDWELVGSANLVRLNATLAIS